MSRFVQGRRVITSLVRHCYPDLPPKGNSVEPRMLPVDMLGRPQPRPIIRETINLLELLSEEEKSKFGYIFSQLLGLPKPPEPPAEGNFVVKLVKFDPEKTMQLLEEIVWVKSTVKVIKHYSETGVGPSVYALETVPSVIKEGVSEEEADEIIAKFKAAGGVAVKELLE